MAVAAGVRARAFCGTAHPALLRVPRPSTTALYGNCREYYLKFLRPPDLA